MHFDCPPMVACLHVMTGGVVIAVAAGATTGAAANRAKRSHAADNVTTHRVPPEWLNVPECSGIRRTGLSTDVPPASAVTVVSRRASAGRRWPDSVRLRGRSLPHS